MGDNIFNLPIDNNLNPNENDMRLVSYIFKTDNNEGGKTPISIKKDEGFTEKLKDVSIVVVIFILINLPQVNPLFSRIVGQDNHMYALLLKTLIFIILYVYIKGKL